MISFTAISDLSLLCKYFWC